MIELYHQFLTEPLFNLLVWLVNVIPGHDFGIAVIVATLIVRFALLPLSAKSIKAQRSLQDLQPKLNEIKEKHKDNKQKQSEELMRFYKENKVNPFSSCLPMVVQFPIIIALYHVFREGLTEESFTQLYSFVARPEVFNSMFLGFLDLSVPNIALAVIAGIAQFFQARYMLNKRKEKKKDEKKPAGKKESAADMASAMTKQMMYVMPVITVFIAMRLPSALALYWVITTVFAIGQQLLIFRKMNPVDSETKKKEKSS